MKIISIILLVVIIDFILEILFLKFLKRNNYTLWKKIMEKIRTMAWKTSKPAKEVYLLIVNDAGYITTELFNTFDQASDRLKAIYHDMAIEGNPESIIKATYEDNTANIKYINGDTTGMKIETKYICI